jgi:hypothetical protein
MAAGGIRLHPNTQRPPGLKPMSTLTPYAALKGRSSTAVQAFVASSAYPAQHTFPARIISGRERVPEPGQMDFWRERDF